MSIFSVCLGGFGEADKANKLESVRTGLWHFGYFVFS